MAAPPAQPRQTETWPYGLWPAGTYASGDANGDALVGAPDIFYLINNIFTGGAAPVGPADVNGDGSVTVADIFYLINYLFAGGPAPL